MKTNLFLDADSEDSAKHEVNNEFDCISLSPDNQPLEVLLEEESDEKSNVQLCKNEKKGLSGNDRFPVAVGKEIDI
ncbi:unnamed protein product [Nezara viridula]|uniref:Uncharacterized protein n=1 Tax=Nezara viridula TaxID=85310 RepID=A0A9P0MSH1_NEZVI|nr:unnamed protein product [Nezara viridula]